MLRHIVREPLLMLGIALAIVPPALVHFLASEQVAWSGITHAVFVTGSAGAATAAAIVLTRAGARRRDARTVVVGTAFTAMGALLVLHGVATPDVLTPGYGLGALSGGATLPVGGTLLALATLPALSRPQAVRALLVLDGAIVAAIVALAATAFVFPALIPAVPEPRSAAALAVLAGGLLLYGVVGWRAMRTYRLTRRFADALVIVGVVWLATALAAAMLLRWYELGWWIGHTLEVLGIAAVAAPVVADLFRAAPSRPLLGDLRAAELVQAEEAFLGPRVRALTQLLAERDAYTEEHTRRVALRAAQVGDELGLPPERLRVLAAAGLLHDMGKLAVPDRILKKPGPLTPEEYDQIKEHAEAGKRLLREFGFPQPIRRLVLDHHERLDGTGYPRGLGEAQLDLETRVLAVCDVYDALISPRVYRAAWEPQRALGFLRDRAGVEFDGRCIDALASVLDREAGPMLALAS